MGKLSREACGSGLPELKHILAGEMFPSDYGPFTSLKVLFAKTFGLISGASVAPLGREGPLVHTSACITNLLLSKILYFRDIIDSQELSRQCFAASAAVGVASSFNAPVGGLLFSVEVTSTYYLISNYWKSFVAAVAASIVCNSILSAYKYNGSYTTGLSVRVLEMDEQLTTSSQLLAWEYLVFVGMAVVMGYGSSFYLQGVPSPFSQLPHRVKHFRGLLSESQLRLSFLTLSPVVPSPTVHRNIGKTMRYYGKGRPLLLTFAVAVVCCFVIYWTEQHTPDGMDTQVRCSPARALLPSCPCFSVHTTRPCSHAHILDALPRVLRPPGPGRRRC